MARGRTALATDLTKFLENKIGRTNMSNEIEDIVEAMLDPVGSLFPDYATFIARQMAARGGNSGNEAEEA